MNGPAAINITRDSREVLNLPCPPFSLFLLLAGYRTRVIFHFNFINKLLADLRSFISSYRRKCGYTHTEISIFNFVRDQSMSSTSVKYFH